MSPPKVSYWLTSIQDLWPYTGCGSTGRVLVGQNLDKIEYVCDDIYNGLTQKDATFDAYKWYDPVFAPVESPLVQDIVKSAEFITPKIETSSETPVEEPIKPQTEAVSSGSVLEKSSSVSSAKKWLFFGALLGAGYYLFFRRK